MTNGMDFPSHLAYLAVLQNYKELENSLFQERQKSLHLECGRLGYWGYLRQDQVETMFGVGIFEVDHRHSSCQQNLVKPAHVRCKTEDIVAALKEQCRRAGFTDVIDRRAKLIHLGDFIRCAAQDIHQIIVQSRAIPLSKRFFGHLEDTIDKSIRQFVNRTGIYRYLLADLEVHAVDIDHWVKGDHASHGGVSCNRVGLEIGPVGIVGS